jgi:hypothetical protein
MTLKRAENVRLFRAMFGRVTVHVGRQQYSLRQRYSKQQWAAERDGQRAYPVLVVQTADRNLWQFRGKFYWETDGLDASQVNGLLVARDMREKQRIDRAQAIAAMGSLPRSPIRGAIPDDLKLFVFTRDGGCCRKCGSRNEIQYDHVIPVSMGGATSEANLQILCGPCNRRKGAGLA